jgi:hypothetical protein
LILLGFQAWVTARLDLNFPDRARDWTAGWTGPEYQQGRIYLLEPFMNNQVAWDSEYYLAIAVGGYDDPRSPQLILENNLAAQPGPGFDQSLSLSVDGSRARLVQPGSGGDLLGQRRYTGLSSL